MAPAGLGEAGPVQLLGHGGTGRPHHQLAAPAARPRGRPGDDIDPNRVDQDDAPQVEHDMLVALADQVAEVLPELRRGVRVEIAAHGDDGGAIRGCGGGLQQWGHDGLLSWGAAIRWPPAARWRPEGPSGPP